VIGMAWIKYSLSQSTDQLMLPPPPQTSHSVHSRDVSVPFAKLLSSSVSSIGFQRVHDGLEDDQQNAATGAQAQHFRNEALVERGDTGQIGESNKETTNGGWKGRGRGGNRGSGR
jgi:hypothetical protein